MMLTLRCPAFASGRMGVVAGSVVSTVVGAVGEKDGYQFTVWSQACAKSGSVWICPRQTSAISWVCLSGLKEPSCQNAGQCLISDILPVPLSLCLREGRRVCQGSPLLGKMPMRGSVKENSSAYGPKILPETMEGSQASFIPEQLKVTLTHKAVVAYIFKPSTREAEAGGSQ